METTVPEAAAEQQLTIDPPKMTTEQAEAYAIVIRAIEPFFDKQREHVERVNEQSRAAARPLYAIAGVIVTTVAAAALWAAIGTGDAQLARDLMFPLLSFAGGLGIGRAASPPRK